MFLEKRIAEAPDKSGMRQIDKVCPLSKMDEGGKSEYWATLALKHCPGLGARTQAKLLKHFHTAYNALENLSSWPACGIRKECAENIKNGKWRLSAKKEWDAAYKLKTGILLWSSPQYPVLLRDIPDAPILLYTRGNIQLLTSPCIALVGSRKASCENREIARTLAKSLSCCGITIVSGMATGIDAESHKGALSEIGKSIGVLGTGINFCYPSINRDLFIKMNEEGLLLSEFAPDARPKPMYFPIRNRIISGLSLGTVVVEAAVKSGSLITAQLACDQNREVFSVPGSVYSERSLGCQNLIRQGAHPVFGHEDILRELSQVLKNFEKETGKKIYADNDAEKKSSQALNPPESKGYASNSKVFENEKEEPDPFISSQMQSETAKIILNCLTNGPCHIEQIAQQTGLEMNELNSGMIMLELAGSIRRMPGAKFELIK